MSSSEFHTNPLTLTRFLLQERANFKHATGNFAMLLQSIQLAVKAIAAASAKAGVANLGGLQGGSNVSGDDQKKLDVIANDIFINALSFSNQVYIMASEEDKEPIILDHKSGGYAVVFDPLDGSSNIDCNVGVGTIFGIYRKEPRTLDKPSMKDLLKPGSELIAAGYALYGSATMIVLTTGLGVNGFTLDPSIGEFILTHHNIRIPKKGNIYSINEGNAGTWDAATTELVESYKTGKKPRRGRYIGSMVADVHRTLLYGGIFCYPADAKSPQGKLRLLYECNPIAFIMEQAGGRASTGTKRVLDIVPTSIHQRTPIFCGSEEDVAQVDELYKKHAATKPTASAAPKAKL